LFIVFSLCSLCLAFLFGSFFGLIFFFLLLDGLLAVVVAVVVLKGDFLGIGSFLVLFVVSAGG
jgi:hypothetical protein